jgi:hypothetical protein
MVRGFLVDEAGQRHEVDDQLGIDEADRLVSSRPVTPDDVRVRWTLAVRLEVVSDDSVRVRLNGSALAWRATRLSHGDVLTIGGTRFTVALVHGAPTLEDAVPLEVLEHVEDDARWEAWRDALLERGAALGERMADQATSLPDAPACLVRGVREGVLRLQWRHGFVRAAQLCPQPGSIAASAALAGLLRYPFGGVLTELCVHAGPVEDQAQVAEGLGSQGLPALRALSVGPVPVERAARLQLLAGDLACRGAPRLARRTVHVMEHARLKFSSADVRAVSGPVDLGHFQVAPNLWTGWRAARRQAASPALFHNGRNVRVANLFPGDEVRCGDVAFTFEGDLRQLDCPVPSS